MNSGTAADNQPSPNRTALQSYAIKLLMYEHNYPKKYNVWRIAANTLVKPLPLFILFLLSQPFSELDAFFRLPLLIMMYMYIVMLYVVVLCGIKIVKVLFYPNKHLITHVDILDVFVHVGMRAIPPSDFSRYYLLKHDNKLLDVQEKILDDLKWKQYGQSEAAYDLYDKTHISLFAPFYKMLGYNEKLSNEVSALEKTGSAYHAQYMRVQRFRERCKADYAAGGTEDIENNMLNQTPSLSVDELGNGRYLCNHGESTILVKDGRVVTVGRNDKR